MHEILTHFHSLPLQIKVGIGITILGLSCVVLGIFLVYKSASFVPVAAQSEGFSQEFSGSLIVDVSGAVVQPGVYQLEVGDRWAQAVKAAGGVLPQADPQYVSKELNLAKEASDGDKIYIPFSDEMAIPAIADEPESGPLNSRESGISINDASLSELDSLPGIGAKRAQDIIDNRPYFQVEELVERKILSETIFEDLKGLILL